jgi:anti-sigma factor RsiW
MADVNPVPERVSMLLSCYLDGELTRDELTEVVAALENDVDAIAEFRRLKDARKVLRTLPMLHVPLELIPGGHLGEQLSAYLDGELVTEEIPVVSSHLDGCPDCRRELGDLDRSRTAVRALPGVEPPVFLAPRIEAKRSRRGLKTAVAVAAGAAAVSLAFAVTPLGDSDEPAAVSITELESRHTARASTVPAPTGVQVGSP